MLQVRDGRPYEGSQVVSEIFEAGDYYIAEDYHQQVGDG
jgi:peptide methionine sulfoxide reductase MsrA